MALVTVVNEQNNILKNDFLKNHFNDKIYSILVGYHYAKVSVKTFIAHLIRNYRVTTKYTDINQLQLVQNVSLRLTEKHMVKLEPRLE